MTKILFQLSIGAMAYQWKTDDVGTMTEFENKFNTQ